MPKKNQSKSDKENLPCIQKKPLPKPDPNLRQTMNKKKHEDSVGIKSKDSVGIKRHK